jgi:hypothetical protein
VVVAGLQIARSPPAGKRRTPTARASQLLLLATTFSDPSVTDV